MKTTTRRTVLKTGAAALGAAVVSNALAVPRIPGETRVLLLLGDYWHNGVACSSSNGMPARIHSGGCRREPSRTGPAALPG